MTFENVSSVCVWKRFDFNGLLLTSHTFTLTVLDMVNYLSEHQVVQKQTTYSKFTTVGHLGVWQFCHSTFSSREIICSNGINTNFVFPYVCSFLLDLYHTMLVNVKLDVSGYKRITLQGYRIHLPCYLWMTQPKPIFSSLYFKNFVENSFEALQPCRSVYSRRYKSRCNLCDCLA